MTSTEGASARGISLRPWHVDNVALLHRMNTPAMTEHIGGPETDEAVEARLAKELSIIRDKGFSHYFLVVEEIANEREGALKVVKLNTDENQQTAIQYNVMSIPTLILFRHGQPAKTVIGAYPKKRLEAELEPALA